MDIGIYVDFVFFYLGCHASNFLAKYFYTSIILDDLWFLKNFDFFKTPVNFFHVPCARHPRASMYFP
jgi:hypothetical protein